VTAVKERWKDAERWLQYFVRLYVRYRTDTQLPSLHKLTGGFPVLPL
jgi:hypothetical protein